MKLLKMLSKITVSVAVIIGMFWNQPIYRHYTLSGKGQIKDLKIIFLSDLHNSVYGNEQQKLLKMIEDEAPDLILTGGDMSDEKTDITGARLLFEGLKDKYPIYYVTGNHEHWMSNTEDIYTMLEENNVTLLDNQNKEIVINGQTIKLYGLKDPDANLHLSSNGALKQSLGFAGVMSLEDELTDELASVVGKLDMDNDVYKILVSHRPEHIKLYAGYDVDLVLSGHAHGGQARIPFILNGLYAPNQGFLPRFAGGYYNINENLDFIVSRGLSFRKTLPRVMNPPEVVVITFE